MGAVKYIGALLALIACWQLGVWLSLIIPLPGALLGLLLLLAILLLLGRVPPSLQVVSQFLLLHLSLFFVPASLGVLFYAQALGQHLWAFGLAIVFTTMLSLALTGWLSQYLLGKQGKARDD